MDKDTVIYLLNHYLIYDYLNKMEYLTLLFALTDLLLNLIIFLL